MPFLIRYIGETRPAGFTDVGVTNLDTEEQFEVRLAGTPSGFTVAQLRVAITAQQPNRPAPGDKLDTVNIGDVV